MLASRYGIRRVFVATDSPWVLGALRAAAPELAFIALDNTHFNRSALEESVLRCRRAHPDKRDDGVRLPDGCTGNDAWLEHRLGRGEVRPPPRPAPRTNRTRQTAPAPSAGLPRGSMKQGPSPRAEARYPDGPA